MCIRDSPKGIPHRWQESGSLSLPGNYGVGLIPPLRGGSPEPPLFGIWMSRGFRRPSPEGGELVLPRSSPEGRETPTPAIGAVYPWGILCLLYTSDAADERSSVDLGGRRIIKKKKTTR